MIRPTGICLRTVYGGTGIIQFRTREKAAVAISTTDEHEAKGEQRRRVEAPSIIEAACDRPISRGRVVNFRARERAGPESAACDQHPPIAKQCCGMAPAGNIEAAGRRPISGGRVVEFRACQYTVIRPSSYQHLAVGQQRRRVVTVTGSSGATGETPSLRGWIVELRAVGAAT